MEKRSTPVLAFPLRLPRGVTHDGWWLSTEPVAPACVILPFVRPASASASPRAGAFPPTDKDASE
ncbi:hypothetical protein GCM10011611_26770 [Aliidongia dinghuensis]|uniref:Uncharacterized protein n=1 Tax=Aliidongia dinghuensis TaxID=1867774 RepID=A0A8J2YV75_9PROT|nr:hypothetical protein [Aliidongia dinghuensis]GGF19493.1 hypothetical protein GCM10011611_26770 [Aliidongia dinghuensis]